MDGGAWGAYLKVTGIVVPIGLPLERSHQRITYVNLTIVHLDDTRNSTRPSNLRTGQTWVDQRFLRLILLAFQVINLLDVADTVEPDHGLSSFQSEA